MISPSWKTVRPSFTANSSLTSGVDETWEQASGGAAMQFAAASVSQRNAIRPISWLDARRVRIGTGNPVQSPDGRRYTRNPPVTFADRRDTAKWIEEKCLRLIQFWQLDLDAEFHPFDSAVP